MHFYFTSLQSSMTETTTFLQDVGFSKTWPSATLFFIAIHREREINLWVWEWALFLGARPTYQWYHPSRVPFTPPNPAPFPYEPTPFFNRHVWTNKSSHCRKNKHIWLQVIYKICDFWSRSETLKGLGGCRPDTNPALAGAGVPP